MLAAEVGGVRGVRPGRERLEFEETAVRMDQNQC